jgi:hypothetical protein
MRSSSPLVACFSKSRLVSRSKSRLWSRSLHYAVWSYCLYLACLCGLWPVVVRDISISDGDS